MLERADDSRRFLPRARVATFFPSRRRLFQLKPIERRTSATRAVPAREPRRPHPCGFRRSTRGLLERAGGDGWTAPFVCSRRRDFSVVTDLPDSVHGTRSNLARGGDDARPAPPLPPFGRCARAGPRNLRMTPALRPRSLSIAILRPPDRAPVFPLHLLQPRARRRRRPPRPASPAVREPVRAPAPFVRRTQWPIRSRFFA